MSHNAACDNDMSHNAACDSDMSHNAALKDVICQLLLRMSSVIILVTLQL